MRRLLTSRLWIFANLIALAVIVAVAAWIYASADAKARASIQENINTEESLLASLAVTTDSNGADPMVDAIIKDCPDRAEFENLLVKLGSLDQQDLIKEQQLFESCGNFFAVRKAFMVSKMTREADILSSYATLADEYARDTTRDETVSKWHSLVAMEQKRSGLLSEQVSMQREIIAKLLTGVTAGSSEMRAIMLHAGNITDQLSVLDTQIDTLRASLIKP